MRYLLFVSMALLSMAASAAIADAPNDPKFGEQWYLRYPCQPPDPCGLDMRAVAAWDRHHGASGARIGIIDKGLPDATHYEFLNRLVTNQGSFSPTTRHTTTAAAGVMAATGNNGEGICGVNWDATLYAYQIIPEVTDEFAFARAWLRDAGARVIAVPFVS